MQPKIIDTIGFFFIALSYLIFIIDNLIQLNILKNDWLLVSILILYNVSNCLDLQYSVVCVCDLWISSDQSIWFISERLIVQCIPNPSAIPIGADTKWIQNIRETQIEWEGRFLFPIEYKYKQ